MASSTMDFYLITGFIIGLMFVAIFWFRNIRHHQVNTIASIVTVIGVLGTFVGIAWGLWNFNTGEIESSVPKLLEGLKVAFITSIVGILGSIFLKWTTLNKQRKQSASVEAYTGATVDDLAELLRDIHKAQKDEGNETKAALQSIERSLTGEGDSTVLTQLQKLRTTFSDKQDDLIKEFRDFAKKSREDIIKGLIEALSDAIKEFNTNLKEQFGENFKQLNQAVGKLLEWQEQYQEQMDKLAEEFRIAAESVEKSRQSLDIISNRSDAIVSSAEQLEPILQGIQHQINQLNASLEAFSKLADNAREAFPIIENRLDDLTERFSVVIQDAIDDSQASMETQRDALTEQTENLERTVENTGKFIQQQSASVFQNSSEQIAQVIKETEEFVRQNTGRINEQIRLIDQDLKKQLRESLESLGSQLTSLSGKFVDDYTPLTKELRRVVEVARNLPSSQRFNQPQQQ